jgi:hypothetical protein
MIFKLQNPSYCEDIKHQCSVQIIDQHFTDYSAQITHRIRRLLSGQSHPQSHSSLLSQPAAVRVLSAVKQVKKLERDALANELDAMLDKMISSTLYPLAVAV